MAEGRPRQPLRRRIKACVFCQTAKEPDYKDPETLSRFITERGKIIGRSRSGLCARHQRQVTREIKRARYLALLPFIAGA